MNTHTAFTQETKKLLCLSVLFAIVSCGGGGESASPVPAAAPTPAPTTTPAPSAVAAEPTEFPKTGIYETLFTFDGPRTALRGGLSLIHPSQRSVEYLIEPPSLAFTDSQIIQSGTVDAANSKVTNLVPSAYLYIVGGDAKRISLAANGADPKESVQAAGVNTLCKFAAQTDYITPQGADYANPLRSKYFASTKGADNRCGTADDGQADITFSATGKPIVSVLDVSAGQGLGRVLATLRNPSTLEPSALVYGRTMVVSQPTSSSYPIAASPLTTVVDVSVDLLVGESGGRLIVLDIAGKTTQLDSSITSGTGWETAGYDKDNFYVYRNSASLQNISSSATWKLVKISKASPQATLLASGSGNFGGVSVGRNSIYGTLATASGGASLVKYPKDAPGLRTTIEGFSTSSFAVLMTSNQGVHMLLRTNANTGIPSINFIDESTNAIIYSSTAGSILDVARSDVAELNNSNRVTDFVFVDGFTSSAFALGANLTAYNAEKKSATVMGRFPTAVQFGASRALGGTGGNTGATFATASLVAVSANVDYLTTPRQYFSFEPRIANSIQYTTTRR